LANANDPRHAGEIDRDASARRIDLPFQRRAGAEGNKWHVMLTGEANDCLNLLHRFGKYDGIGRLHRQCGQRACVLLADRSRRRASPGTNARQLRNRGGEAFTSWSLRHSGSGLISRETDPLGEDFPSFPTTGKRRNL
jgi:hypothetical protein